MIVFAQAFGANVDLLDNEIGAGVCETVDDGWRAHECVVIGHRGVVVRSGGWRTPFSAGIGTYVLHIACRLLAARGQTVVLSEVLFDVVEFAQLAGDRGHAHFVFFADFLFDCGAFVLREDGGGGLNDRGGLRADLAFLAFEAVNVLVRGANGLEGKGRSEGQDGEDERPQLRRDSALNSRVG